MAKNRLISLASVLWIVVLCATTAFRALADCASFGLPFTDLGSTSFCAAIAEAYYTGITHGTSATTFSPAASVNREQAAIFATHTLDAAVALGPSIRGASSASRSTFARYPPCLAPPSRVVFPS